MKSLKNRTRSAAVLLLIAATFLGYWPALRNGFVWDDTALVLRDPLIRSWRLIPEGFRHFLFLDATASDFYRPLQRLTFTADYALYGFEAPWGWHLTSVIIHAAAAVALFFLLTQILRRFAFAALPSPERLAFAVALLWTIHPLHTSAITYVAGRADPLAALFGFSALTLALISLDRGKTVGWATLGAAGCFLAELLSKESGVVGLLIWFLLLAWQRAPGRVFAKWVTVAVAVLGLYGTLRLTAEHTSPPPAPTTPLAVRPILASRAFAEYAGLIVAPLTLRMERDVSTVPQATPEATIQQARGREYQTLFGVLLVIGLITWFRRSSTTGRLALAAFVLAYLPISNLFSLNATVAEHWLYVPSAFLFLAALLTLHGWQFRMRPMGQRCGLGALALWMIFLCLRTAQQQDVWHDQRSFLDWNIAHGGDTARMHVNRGNLESSAGRHTAAVAEFHAALERAPELPLAWFGLANASIRGRDFAAAHAALDRLPPSPLLAPGILQTRAVLEYLETGRDTGDLLRQAVEAAPKNWEARKRYLEHLDERGQTAQAARELRAFLQIEPFRADSWRLLGTFLEKLGQPAVAAASYVQAAERDVRDATSRARRTALTATIPR